MKPRRNLSPELGSVPVPLSMLDMTTLILAFVLSQAIFQPESLPFPRVQVPDPTAVNTGSGPGLNVVLKATGELSVQNQPVAIGDLARYLESRPDQSDPIILNIETDVERRFVSQAMIQLLHDLSMSKVADRVQVRYESLAFAKPSQ